MSIVLRALWDVQDVTTSHLAVLERHGAPIWDGDYFRRTCAQLLDTWRASTDPADDTNSLAAEAFEGELAYVTGKLDTWNLPSAWIHGDLSPGNVYLDRDGRATFLDLERCGIGAPLVGLGSLLDLTTPSAAEHLMTSALIRWGAHSGHVGETLNLCRRLALLHSVALQWESISRKHHQGQLLDPIEPFLDIAVRRVSRKTAQWRDARFRKSAAGQAGRSEDRPFDRADSRR